MKRRNLLNNLAAASVGATTAAIASSARAADADAKTDKSAKKDKAKVVDFLFVQNAEGATLKDGVLTLKSVAKETLYFSDRPDRITGRITTVEFVDHWAKGTDSFKADPPNAVLTVFEKPEGKDVVVVLKEPRLEGGDLIYTVEVTEGDKALEGEVSALFIDVIGYPATPLSYAGAARRTTRRTVRRRVY